MRVTHLVLNRNSVKNALTREEINILDVLITKVRNYEGERVYSLENVTTKHQIRRD